MLSASNIPTPSHSVSYSRPTTVLLLPAFIVIENVTPKSVDSLITGFLDQAPTNTSPLEPFSIPASLPDPYPTAEQLTSRPCPHRALVLLCSQKTRDARCGQSAPLLRKEFERHLRPLGLYRDLHDERPGGVGIYFISHVGGHKFSANVMIYRHSSVASQQKAANGVANGHANGAQKRLEDLKLEDDNGQEVLLDANKEQEAEGNGEAAQCIWLARVKPEDCENIIK